MPEKSILEQRSSPRRALNIAAILHQNDHAIDCVIRDISTTGVQLVARSAPMPATEFSLAIRKVGQVEGTVVWRDGHRVGAAFLGLTPSMKEQLRRFHG